MIDRTHQLPVIKQVKALGMSRGCVYYRPKPLSESAQTLMTQIDRLHMDLPFAGMCRLRDLLRQEGVTVGRKHIGTLMQRMGLEALYRKPRTTQRYPAHTIYPYLLRNLAVTRKNHVWAMDVTYIPMAKGFVYLVAVVDWYTRRVLACRVSSTMDVQFCLDAVEDVLARHGKPAIMNTDQGCQFTIQAFTGLLKVQGVRISMDRRGTWRDNVFVERQWRTVKYEEVDLHAYDSVAEAQASIARYFHFYNSRRPHSSLADQTPDQVYFHSQPQPRAV